jgi:hypothetical protein
MVDIPIYRQQVRRAPVADTRLGIRTNADAMGAPIGEGVQALGRAAGVVSSVYDRIATEERQKADDQQITAAAAKATGLASDLQLEYGKHKLDDAVKTGPDYEKKHASGLDEIAKGLTTESQRQTFAKWRASHEVAFQSVVRNRAYDEGQKSYDITDQVAKEQARRSVVINADPENGDVGLEQVASRVADMHTLNEITARRKGYNATQLAELNRQDSADAYATVISAYNDAGYSLKAQAMFDKNKDALDPKVREHLQKALGIGVTKAVAQSKSAEIWSPDKTIEQMMTEADQIPDQKIQEETKQRLERKHSVHRQAMQDAQGAAMSDAWRKMQTDPLGIDAVTTGEIVAMGPERFGALQAAEKRRLSPAKDDPKLSASLLHHFRMLSVDNPAAFALVDPTAVMGQGSVAPGDSPLSAMTAADFKELSGLIKDAKENGVNGKLVRDNAEKERIIGETLAPLKLDKGAASDDKAKPADQAKVLHFRLRFDEALAQARGDSGKPVSNDDMRKIAAKLASETVVDQRSIINLSRMWNGKDITKPLFESLSEIPDDERANIIQSYQKTNPKAPPLSADGILMRWKIRQEQIPAEKAAQDKKAEADTHAAEVEQIRRDNEAARERWRKEKAEADAKPKEKLGDRWTISG